MTPLALSELMRLARRLKGFNFEAVLRVEVNGNIGASSIVSSEFW
jgi:hypothetical protein